MSNKIKKFDVGGGVGLFNPVAGLGLTALNFALSDFFSKGKEATPMTPEEAERYAIEEGLATLLAQPTPGMAGGPEDIEGVGEQEVDLLQQAAELGNTDLINQITSLSPTETVRNIGTQVGEGIDTVFDILKLPNPTKVIGAPIQKSGTVVWGQTGGSPVIGTGTTPGGTQTGVTTGDPTIDAVLNKVTGVLTGKAAAGDVLSRSTIEDILVGTAATETGMSTEQVRDIIESAKDIVPAPTAIGIDLGKEPKIGPSEVEQLDVIGDMGVLDTVVRGPEQLDVTGDMGDLDTVVKGTPPPESLSLTETTTPKVPTVGDLTPAAIPRTNVGTDEATPEPKIPAIASESSGDGGGGGGGGFGTQTGGVGTVSVDPGPLVDIPGFYDISSDSIIPDYIDKLIERNRQRMGAAEGGHVKKFSGSQGSLVQQGLGGFKLNSNSALGGGTGVNNDENNQNSIMGTLSKFVGDNAPALLTTAVGGLLGLTESGQQQPAGYQGGIPNYKANRSMKENLFATPRGPGSTGRRYFSDVTYTPSEENVVLEGVGLPATTTNGGITEEDLVTTLINTGSTDANKVLQYFSTLYPELYGNTTIEDVNKYLYPDQYAQGGEIEQYYLGGSTDGMADDIPAMIGNSQPAALSDGEFVIPADVVSHLGNGNSDAGAQNLYSMMDRVRTDRTGNPNQGKQIDPNQYLA